MARKLHLEMCESGVGYVDDLSDSFVSNISDSETSDDAKSESEGGITGIKRYKKVNIQSVDK
ncbi:hypothetical protein J6590_090837 [Homalodisca vitripennis]|nr:hypothetical protein J6590_090837 [Homalodisca vitripennis]